MKQKILILFLTLLGTITISYGQLQKDAVCIGEQYTIRSEILDQDREILIRLPLGYDTADTEYPVHFILDGEITFLPYAGVVQILAMAGKIPDAIVVGITNVNRNFDMNPRENADKFLDFITRELAYVIKQDYRANGQQLIAGYSVAGNFVMYALFRATNHFDYFLSGSPYRLNMYDNSYFESLSSDIQTGKTVYTSMGNRDLDDQIEAYLDFCKKLEQQSGDKLKFRYDLEEDRDHLSNVLSNWEDGLYYLYSDWNPEGNAN